MIYAYDENILSRAQTVFAHMLDCAVYLYGYKLDTYYKLFLDSEYARRFESGESSVICGMSGHELAHAVINDHEKIPMKDNSYSVDRSVEYWVGWSLAYYQWHSSRSFRYINEFAPTHEISSMYTKYHEMDIRQFADELDDRETAYKKGAFKRLRIYAGLTQKELAEKTGIPLRSIQQYEQGQKELSHARADVVVRLSKAMYCRIEDII